MSVFLQMSHILRHCDKNGGILAYSSKKSFSNKHPVEDFHYPVFPPVCCSISRVTISRFNCIWHIFWKQLQIILIFYHSFQAPLLSRTVEMSVKQNSWEIAWMIWHKFCLVYKKVWSRAIHVEFERKYFLLLFSKKDFTVSFARKLWILTDQKCSYLCS